MAIPHDSGMRISQQDFSESEQIIRTQTDVWLLILEHYDEIIFKQGVIQELCGVALKAHRKNNVP